MFKVGDLVRVREGTASSSAVNLGWVKKHGWLWVITEAADSQGAFYCKSVATGSSGHYWIGYELEKANEE